MARQTFVSKGMSLIFNMLPRVVIASQILSTKPKYLFNSQEYLLTRLTCE